MQIFNKDKNSILNLGITKPDGKSSVDNTERVVTVDEKRVNIPHSSLEYNLVTIGVSPIDNTTLIIAPEDIIATFLVNDPLELKRPIDSLRFFNYWA